MTYHVGISTGFWYIGKDPALLGLAQKIGGYGATGGVHFVQVDLETIAEFYEPGVKEQIKTMKEKLGIPYVGLHGEIAEIMSPDSAEQRIWDQTHDRLVQAVKFAHDLGFLYVNIHFSAKPIISIQGEAQQRVYGVGYPVVDPYGRPLSRLINGHKATMEEAKKHIPPVYRLQHTNEFKSEYTKLFEEKRMQAYEEAEREYERQIKAMPQLDQAQKNETRNRLRYQAEEGARRAAEGESQGSDFLLRVWLSLSPRNHLSYSLDDGELGAFFIVANWLKETGNPLWSRITGGAEPDDLWYEDEVAFSAAVASMYTYGHVNVKNNPSNKKYLEGKSIKEWCEEKKIYLLFEGPEANKGAEGFYRLFHPKHYYHTIKYLNSPYIKVCIDIEHTVSHALDPDKLFKSLPNDFGKLIFLFHLGQAVPYGGTAHIPLTRGSRAQEQTYKWLHTIQKKGWKEGFILFERGGGRSGSGRTPYEVFEDSVLAIRQIALFLEKGTDPKDLPLEFYGVSEENKAVFAKELVAIKEHAWDPLEGLLSVSEEKHTFLSKSALEKGKAQEWEKRKYR